MSISFIIFHALKATEKENINLSLNIQWNVVKWGEGPSIRMLSNTLQNVYRMLNKVSDWFEDRRKLVLKTKKLPRAFSMWKLVHKIQLKTHENDEKCDM